MTPNPARETKVGRTAETPNAGLTDTWGRRNRTLENRPCTACGTEFRPARHSARFCSKPCARTINGGWNKKPETWWTNAKGYVEGRIWIGDKQIRVKKHRYIMACHLGRALRPDEDVHHKDGNKQNNSIENLQILSHSEHATLSNKEKTYKRGYTLNLTDQERVARSARMSTMRRAAISKALGEQP
jgi:hypothetical protein